MDIMFLITSFVCALLIPLTNRPVFGAKGTLFFIIMILFGMLVLAYAILSIAKFQMAKYDFLFAKKIVSWETGEAKEQKHSKLPYMISCACGAVTGCFLVFKETGYLCALLGALAVAFAVLGWWLMAIKRVSAKKAQMPGFVLSHQGIIINGKAEVFNGYSKGITHASDENGTLKLTVLHKKEEAVLSFEIPDDKKQDVDDFLKDLKAFYEAK